MKCSTFNCNPSVIRHTVSLDTIITIIADTTGIAGAVVRQNHWEERLYQSEDLFWTLRDICGECDWLAVYEALLESKVTTGCIGSDGAFLESVDLAPHRIGGDVRGGNHRHAVAECIAHGIEGALNYVVPELGGVPDAVMTSADVLRTLREQLPHCEWFECYVIMRERGLLEKVQDPAPFGAEFTPPLAIQALIAGGTLRDTMWHKDICPSFRVGVAGYVLWCDAEDRSLRQLSEAKRFWFTHEEEDHPTFESDDVDEVLKEIIRICTLKQD